ncbi:MAG: putative transposase/invertase (TIGR01784 family) [Phenylobacterium sp.]|jgi:predicted transposase/invertase (TIGR01784 family)
MRQSVEVFINPYTDFGFKKLFGEEKNKHLLISLTNDLLDGAEHIVDLTLHNSEYLPDSSMYSKPVFDVYCTNEKGEHFIVEMQKVDYGYFDDQALFYATFPVVEQAKAKKGKWNFNLKAVYCIGILDFVFSDHKDQKEVIHTAQLKDQRNQVFDAVRRFGQLKFIYVEMPNFNKTLEQLENHCDRWLYFIKNLNSLDQMPELFANDVIAEGFELARLAAFSHQERVHYESSLKGYRDMYSILKTAENKSLIKGREEGRKEAREEERQKNDQQTVASVKKMLSKGLSIEDIAEISGLSAADIKDIEAENQID